MSDAAAGWLGVALVAAFLLLVGGLVGRALPQQPDQQDCQLVQVTDQGLVCQVGDRQLDLVIR